MSKEWTERQAWLELATRDRREDARRADVRPMLVAARGVTVR